MADEFKTHRLNATGFKKCDILATEFAVLLYKIEQLVPMGRERALVVTNLQTACFNAKRGIAILPENQES